MSQFFRIHPENPQARLLSRAVGIIRGGGVIVYPTDSCYALGCHIGDKGALDRIRSIRQFDSRHNFTLVCRDLSEVAAYGRLENQAFRLIKALTPGPYTFILPATREVPRRVQHARRKTIGVRVPEHKVTQSLLEMLGEPLVSCTLQLPGDELPMTDAQEIRSRLEHPVDLVIDGGNCGPEATTVVDLSDGAPEILRHGKGEAGVLFA